MYPESPIIVRLKSNRMGLVGEFFQKVQIVTITKLGKRQKQIYCGLPFLVVYNSADFAAPALRKLV